MKIVSLNVYGGKVFDPLMEYLAKRRDTDVFCFQEVFHTDSDRTVDAQGYQLNLLRELKNVLDDHVPFFAAECGGLDMVGEQVDFPLRFGSAMFVRKGQIAVEYGTHFVHGEYTEKPRDGNENMPRVLQYVELREGVRVYTVAHFHGLWNGQGKGDSDERRAQSHKVRGFMNSRAVPLILCGDFNLDPGTESLGIISHGFQNLIAGYGITSTRSSLYTKPGKFADYAIVSPTLDVTRFAVPDVAVSDHLPLELTIS